MGTCADCVKDIAQDIELPDILLDVLLEMVTDLLFSLLDGCLTSRDVQSVKATAETPNIFTKYIIRSQARRVAKTYGYADSRVARELANKTLKAMSDKPELVPEFINEYNSVRVDYSNLI